MSQFYFSHIAYNNYMQLAWNMCQYQQKNYCSEFTQGNNQQNLSIQKNQQFTTPFNLQKLYSQIDNQPEKQQEQRLVDQRIGTKRKIKKKRGIDKQKQLQSAKKNSESNLINQFFSIFSCKDQSQEIVCKAIMLSVHKKEDIQKIIYIFYNMMKCMSLHRVKKYVNKKTLLNIFDRKNIQKQIPRIVQKIQTLDFITIDQTCQVIRRCCFYFFRKISLMSILSSKRISVLSKIEHLKKRRTLGKCVSGRF